MQIIKIDWKLLKIKLKWWFFTYWKFSFKTIFERLFDKPDIKLGEKLVCYNYVSCGLYFDWSNWPLGYWCIKINNNNDFNTINAITWELEKFYRERLKND